MDVKPGYKQTEIGVIPEEWEVKSLGELGQFKNGINKAKEEFGHGLPIMLCGRCSGVTKDTSRDS